MQNPKISTEALFDEIEKLSSLKGGLIGGGIYGSILAAANGLPKTNPQSGKKFTKKQRIKNALLGGTFGAAFGGTMGHLWTKPLFPGGPSTWEFFFGGNLPKIKHSPKPVVTNRNLTYRPEYLKPIQGGKTGKPGQPDLTTKLKLHPIEGGKSKNDNSDWILPEPKKDK